MIMDENKLKSSQSKYLYYLVTTHSDGLAGGWNYSLFFTYLKFSYKIIGY